MDSPNPEIYKYEIPGGQYSNFAAQVKEMGAGNDFNDIKRLYKEADEVLGNIIKVTPTSKVVGDMAIFMLKNDLTKDNILEKGKDLSYPDSIVQSFKGALGQPEGGFPEKLQRIVLKGQEPITVRPGKFTVPMWILRQSAGIFAKTITWNRWNSRKSWSRKC